MSLLIISDSVLEASDTIISGGYFQKLNTTTIKGKTSCKTKKDLLNFMVLQVLSIEEIPVTSGSCDCLKDEFNFTQPCSEEPPVPEETFFRITQNGDFRIDGDGNYRIYQ